MPSLENHVCTDTAPDSTGWPHTVSRTRTQQSEMEIVSPRGRGDLVSISGMGLSECVS